MKVNAVILGGTQGQESLQLILSELEQIISKTGPVQEFIWNAGYLKRAPSKAFSTRRKSRRKF